MQPTSRTHVSSTQMWNTNRPTYFSSLQYGLSVCLRKFFVLDQNTKLMENVQHFKPLKTELFKIWLKEFSY